MRNYRRLTAEQRRVLERHGLPQRRRWRLTTMGKDILLSWFIIACLFFLIGFFMGAIVVECDGDHAARTMPAGNRPEHQLSAMERADEPQSVPVVSLPVKPEEIGAEKPADSGIDFEWDGAVQNYVSLGEFKLTSYCACEKCCGYWATIRPVDEHGNPIVYTASGAVARQGVTVAADTSLLPFGTVLLIGGDEFIVQDVGGAIRGKHIDIYFNDHRAALEFGVRYETIYRKGNV